jgi:hypothetical protein
VQLGEVNCNRLQELKLGEVFENSTVAFVPLLGFKRFDLA